MFGGYETVCRAVTVPISEQASPAQRSAYPTYPDVNTCPDTQHSLQKIGLPTRTVVSQPPFFRRELFVLGNVNILIVFHGKRITGFWVWFEQCNFLGMHGDL